MQLDSVQTEPLFTTIRLTLPTQRLTQAIYFFWILAVNISVEQHLA